MRVLQPLIETENTGREGVFVMVGLIFKDGCEY